MATDFDRDDRPLGLLRDTLRSQPVTGPCVDAAMLAAWADNALTPEDTAVIDTHLATCARCRELTATLVMMPEAEPAPAATVVSFPPRPNGRWKVIVGAMSAVAASALIWVAVRDGAPAPGSSSEAILAEQRAASGVGGNVASPAAAPSRPAQSANPFRPRPDAASESELRQGQQGQQSQRALGTPRPESKAARENNARLAESRQNNAKPSPTPVEPPARSAAPPLPAAVTVPPPPPPPAMPAPRPPAAPPPAATTADARSDLLRSSETFFATAPIIAEFVVGADLQAQEVEAFGAVADLNRAGGAGRGGGGGGRGAGGGAAAGGVARRTTGAVVAEPVRWRLRGASTAAVERSSDAGATWLPVPIPVTPLLAGGSAPANTVCWLAGRAGTVLLSTDGTTFRQVTKPVDADLVSVRAIDARSATVRTADGRTFATTDGGKTWTPRSDSPSQ